MSSRARAASARTPLCGSSAEHVQTNARARLAEGFAGNTPDAPKPMSAFLTGVKALVVSLPGAFTPT